MSAWQIPRRAKRLPGTEAHNSVHVWTGDVYAANETVTLMARPRTRIGLVRGEVFVGVVSESSRQAAVQEGLSSLEADVDAAIFRTNGLYGAIGALLLIKGLPNEEPIWNQQLLVHNFATTNHSV